MKKIAAIIPARYQSSRFPGKPLAKICGIPMIVRVYQRAKEVIEDVYVATDSLKIKQLCDEYNIPTIMTSDHHKTGTDRVAEAASILEEKYEFYINIQGDEPIFPTDIIYKIYDEIDNEEGCYDVYNCMSKINDEFDVSSVNVPKVVFGKSLDFKDILLYISRSPIPFRRDPSSADYYKQIGIYCFSRNALKLYSEWNQTPLEKSESIEILRFIENEASVVMIESNGASFSVDRPEDISKIEHILITSE